MKIDLKVEYMLGGESGCKCWFSCRPSTVRANVTLHGQASLGKCQGQSQASHDYVVKLSTAIHTKKSEDP